MAKLLTAKLNEGGAIHAFLLDSRGKSLQQRVDAANLHGADLLISIHHDSVQPQYMSQWSYGGNQRKYSDRFSGYSLFVSLKNSHPDESLGLATDVGTQLSAAGFTPSLHHAEKIPGENRTLVNAKLGIYQFDDLIVLKLPPIPAVLLECGVIVNREEETKLSNPKYQAKMAGAVAAGIEHACQSIAISRH